VNAAWKGVTLAVDASTYTGTVAVLRDGVVAAAGSAAMRGEEEERLMPAVIATIADAGCTLRDVAQVVCGAGPGSFTSLRIAGAIAKGVAMGNGVPLYAVSSLALIIAGADPPLAEGRWLALLDAMRGERYAASFDVGPGGAVRPGDSPFRVAVADLAPTSARLHALPVGPLESTVGWPHARGIARMLDAIGADGPVALDSWEPDYGRLAEAQVKWEAAQGRPLSA
jgi:tRNA threonylcarbamoyladenosine biosynthesis protein TsaB